MPKIDSNNEVPALPKTQVVAGKKFKRISQAKPFRQYADKSPKKNGVLSVMGWQKLPAKRLGLAGSQGGWGRIFYCHSLAIWKARRYRMAIIRPARSWPHRRRRWRRRWGRWRRWRRRWGRRVAFCMASKRVGYITNNATGSGQDKGCACP